MNYASVIRRESGNIPASNLTKYLLVFVLVSMVIAATGCGAPARKNTDYERQSKAVKVMETTEEKNPVALNYVGTVDSEELVKCSFKVAGKVNKIYVSEGDQVKKGDRLAQLDKTDLQYQLSAARASMNAASADIRKARDAADYAGTSYERVDELYQKGAASTDALDQIKLKKHTAESDYQQARSQYAAARADYSYKQNLIKDSILYAEQDGYVAQKVCNENERVGAYTPVIVLRSGTQIVNIGIPQQELAQIKPGAAADVEVDGERARGIITSIAEVPDTATRTYKAEVSVQGKTFRLGSIAKVSVNIGEQQGIWIPLTAVFSDEGEDCVYVAKDQRAFKRTIAIRSIHEDQAMVTGVKADESLIISGMNNLDDGTLITVREQE